MTNAGKLFFYAGDRVDYVIVHNPAKARGDLFKGSQLEKQLMELRREVSHVASRHADHVAGD